MTYCPRATALAQVTQRTPSGQPLDDSTSRGGAGGGGSACRQLAATSTIRGTSTTRVFVRQQAGSEQSSASPSRVVASALEELRAEIVELSGREGDDGTQTLGRVLGSLGLGLGGRPSLRFLL